MVFSGTVMRGFDCFSDQELAQIALQTAIPIEIPTTCANFGDFRQRCHSDATLTRIKPLSIYPIPVSFFNSVSVLSAVTIGECSYSPVNSTCTSKSTARQIEYNRHANAK